jgi:hypothetical protein
MSIENRSTDPPLAFDPCLLCSQRSRIFVSQPLVSIVKIDIVWNIQGDDSSATFLPGVDPVPADVEDDKRGVATDNTTVVGDFTSIIPSLNSSIHLIMLLLDGETPVTASVSSKLEGHVPGLEHEIVPNPLLRPLHQPKCHQQQEFDWPPQRIIALRFDRSPVLQ